LNHLLIFPTSVNALALFFSNILNFLYKPYISKVKQLCFTYTSNQDEIHNRNKKRENPKIVMRVNSQQPHLYFHGQSNISSISFSPEKRSIQKKSKSDDSLTLLAIMQLKRQMLVKQNYKIYRKTYLDSKTQQMAGEEKRRQISIFVQCTFTNFTRLFNNCYDTKNNSKF
jgi:hypothetical protein